MRSAPRPYKAPCLASILVVTFALGCDTPTAPKPHIRAASPLAGIYTLTIEVDDKCKDIPATLKIRTYVVELRDTPNPFSYLQVNPVDEVFGQLGGDLWGRTPNELYRFHWNYFDPSNYVGCDGSSPDPTGAKPVYICGDGGANANGDGTIIGVLSGAASLEGGSACLNANHPYVLRRRS